MISGNMALLGMLQASDSMLPIGQFTMSNGLETFVLEGRLRKPEDLKEYLSAYLTVAETNDLLALMLAYGEDLIELDALASAGRGPAEMRRGSRKLCLRFLKIWQEMGSYPELTDYYKKIKAGQCRGAYPIAVGLYGKELGLKKEETATLFLYSQLSAIVVNAVKTVPLSQIKGQIVLSQTLEKIPGCVERACCLTMEDFGRGGCMFDIEAMRHEYLYSRQYMS